MALCACEFEAASGDVDPGASEPSDGSVARDGIADTGTDRGPAALAPTPVDSIDDLPGDYYRLFPLPGQISLLTLGRLDVDATGDYAATRSCGLPTCFAEIGRYHATPENPAIGYAFIQMFASGSALPTDTYIIDAIWRDSNGDVGALQLRRVLQGGVVGPPFFLYAQWWTAAAEPGDEPDPILALANELTADELVDYGELEPEIAAAIASARTGDLYETADAVADAARRVAYADTGLCGYYRGLQDYYAIRALQCAYSLCYPLSPWYGFWADYYRQLADAACGDES